MADGGYAAERLRREIVERGSEKVTGRRNRERPVTCDPGSCRARRRVEVAIKRLRAFRRIATRYDRLAANFQPAMALAAVATCWI
ncbi:transposase [Geminicoccaceae bacterium 1502E]|nr:transposase [Geminicoccaceae bacterium 1502E]